MPKVKNRESLGVSYFALSIVKHETSSRIRPVL